MDNVLSSRIRDLVGENDLSSDYKPEGPVLYWMQRDQRSADNWALVHAQNLAQQKHKPLAVVFVLSPEFLQAEGNHFQFMLEGLRQQEMILAQKNIPLYLLQGDPGEEIVRFCRELSAIHLVMDFNPLKIVRNWKEAVLRARPCPVAEVDAHNIVPVWQASHKKEFAAYTLRPKLQRLLPEYLMEFPALRKQSVHSLHKTKIEWSNLLSKGVSAQKQDLTWVTSGAQEAARRLADFIQNGLADYESKRNDPTQEATSNLSAYLHFGQISAQRVALSVMAYAMDGSSREAFLEELIVRRELAENYCFYEPNYDSFAGFPEWARKTLDEHDKDTREYLYDYESWEKGETHDQLWNAAQMQLVTTGYMHGYMRMYWAKKILEWSRNSRAALATAQSLNDRFQLDGRDPNGYTGVAWSVGGVHDRAWPERPIFGKIRYMNYNGAKRKFPVDDYIKRFNHQQDLFT